MAKIGRSSRSGQFVTTTHAKSHPRTTVTERVTIKNEASGRELPLRGYGSMEGKYKVKPGVDISKPIAAQAQKSKKK